MGHVRLGGLPQARKWAEVVEMPCSGADDLDVASASARAAESALADAIALQLPTFFAPEPAEVRIALGRPPARRSVRRPCAGFLRAPDPCLAGQLPQP
jgi:hypothetical protein